MWAALPGAVLVTAALLPERGLAQRAGQAAARIELELAAARELAVGAHQQWYELLTALKVDKLRIRGPQAGDEVGITTAGTAQAPVYRVVGQITARNELLLPGGRFSPRDRERLGNWLKKLREGGPRALEGDEKLPFGLRQEQFMEVSRDLGRPIEFETREGKLAEVLGRAGGSLEYRLLVDAAARGALEGAEPVLDEVRGLSTGTALAYLLRPAGLMLQPRPGADGQPEYLVAVADARQSAWPVGWKPQQKESEVLPELFQVLNVELTDVPLDEVLNAISERLKAPILLDRHALLWHDIDVHEVRINLPSKRTSYVQALRRVLAQAKLKYELRLDEQDRPFLWITTQYPVRAAAP